MKGFVELVEFSGLVGRDEDFGRVVDLFYVFV